MPTASGPPIKPRPKVVREWELLKRDGPVQRFRSLRALRRFHKSVKRIPRDDE